MSQADRAAQFSPFAALTGYDSVIRETGRLTTECTELTESAREELDGKLRVVINDPEAEFSVSWFCPDEWKAGGAYRQTRSRLKKLDPYERELHLENGEIVPIHRIRFLELL